METIAVDITKWRRKSVYIALVLASFPILFVLFMWADYRSISGTTDLIEVAAQNALICGFLCPLPLIPLLIKRIFRKLADTEPTGLKYFKNASIDNNYFDLALEKRVREVSEDLFENDPGHIEKYRQKIWNWKWPSQFYLVALLISASSGPLFFFLILYLPDYPWKAGELEIRLILTISVLATAYFIAKFFRSIATPWNIIKSQTERAPVLWLRSFECDAEGISAPSGGLFGHLHHPYEQMISIHFRPFGPVIAVGIPNEPLPKLGAARTYFPDDEWRPDVLSLMSSAAIIVVIAGKSGGLLWEIDSIVRYGYLKKTLFVSLPGDGWNSLTLVAKTISNYFTHNQPNGQSLDLTHLRKLKRLDALYATETTQFFIGRNPGLLRNDEVIEPLAYYAGVFCIKQEANRQRNTIDSPSKS